MLSTKTFSCQRILHFLVIELIEYAHADKHDDHKKKRYCRAVVGIILAARHKLSLDEVADKGISRTAEKLRYNERAYRRDKGHGYALRDSREAQRYHNLCENLSRVCAEVVCRLDNALVDLRHDRVQRYYHKRNVVVHHAENDRSLRIDKLKRRKTHCTEYRVNKSGLGFEYSHPRICSEKKIHPHRKHYEHYRDSLIIRRAFRHEIRKRIRHNKADHRRKSGKVD